MQLRPLITSFDTQIFPLELNLLGRFVLLVKLVVNEAVRDAGFPYLFVAN